MPKKILRPLIGAVILALLGLVAVPATPAIADDGEKKIRIKKIHRDCEGEDCEHHGEHRAIFIGEGGEMHELGEHGLAWVEAGEHGIHMIGGSGTFLGVQLTDLSDELRAHFGAPAGQGVMVAKVVDGSPAAIAGVQVGDVITAVDGEAVKSGGSLGRLIRQREEGDTVALEVYRGGRVDTLSPTLAKHEPEMRARMLHGDHHLGAGMRKVMVRCEEEEGEKDCEVTVGEGDEIEIGDFDCGGAEKCRVEVECDEAGCECTANGDAVDCDMLPGFSELHGG